MSTVMLKKFFCDTCGAEKLEGEFNNTPSESKPITYSLSRNERCSISLAMDLCRQCQSTLITFVDSLHGGNKGDEEGEAFESIIHMLNEDKDAIAARLKTAEDRLALLEKTWAEASRLAEIKGTMEEGMIKMAEEIYRHMYPYA